MTTRRGLLAGVVLVVVIAGFLAWCRDGAQWSEPEASVRRSVEPGPALGGDSGEAPVFSPRLQQDESSDEPVDAEGPVLVRGRVVDQRLAPVAEGKVRVWATSPRRVVESVRVDDAGRFVLLDPGVLGEVLVGFSGPSHHAVRSAVSLVRGQRLELIVESLASLSVQVVDMEGDPVAGARVHGNRRRQLGDKVDATTTDERGLCELLVAPGATSLLVETDGLSYGHVSRVDVPSTRDVKVVLDHELVKVPVRAVLAPGSEHLSGSEVTLVAYHGIVPIRAVRAIVGGDVVKLPVKYASWERPPAMQRRLGPGTIRAVGRVTAEVQGREPYEVVPLRWAHILNGRAGEAIAVPIEDRRHKVTFRLTDRADAVLARYHLRLDAVDTEQARGEARLPRRGIEVQTDDRGAAVLMCAGGRFALPDGQELAIDGPRIVNVQLPVLAVRGTALPGVGRVRVIRADGRQPLEGDPRFAIRDGSWVAHLADVKPGERLIAQWMDRFVPLAESEFVAGEGPVHVEVLEITRAPHDTRIRVLEDGRPVWSELKVFSGRSGTPRVVRMYEGLRTFDLSRIPPGRYVAEVITRDHKQFNFNTSFHVGDGGQIVLELERADQVWDGARGEWLRK